NLGGVAHRSVGGLGPLARRRGRRVDQDLHSGLQPARHDDVCSRPVDEADAPFGHLASVVDHAHARFGLGRQNRRAGHADGALTAFYHEIHRYGLARRREIERFEQPEANLARARGLVDARFDMNDLAAQRSGAARYLDQPGRAGAQLGRIYLVDFGGDLGRREIGQAIHYRLGSDRLPAVHRPLQNDPGEGGPYDIALLHFLRLHDTGPTPLEFARALFDLQPGFLDLTAADEFAERFEPRQLPPRLRHGRLLR